MSLREHKWQENKDQTPLLEDKLAEQRALEEELKTYTKELS